VACLATDGGRLVVRRESRYTASDKHAWSVARRQHSAAGCDTVASCILAATEGCVVRCLGLREAMSRRQQRGGSTLLLVATQLLPVY
jgi:N-acetylglutamate synthase-like GNAT family acetyltransferase